MNEYLADHPDVEFSVEINGSAATVNLVTTGAAEIGVGYFEGELPPGPEHRMIRPSHIAFVCGAEHVPARKAEVELADPAGLRLVMIPGDSSLRSTLAQALSPAALEAFEIVEVGSCQSAPDVVAAGSGIAVVHAACIDTTDPSLKMLDLRDNVSALDLAVIHRTRIEDPAVQGFAHTLVS